MNELGYLGIDISKETFDVHLEDEGQGASAQFENSRHGYGRLSKWLKKNKVKKVHACLEATGRYGEELAQWLYEKEHRVSIINPAIIKHYGQVRMRRNKTDQLDARLLAEYCRKEQPDLWEPPSPALAELRALTRRLDALRKDLTREKNRLGAGKHPAPVRRSHNALIKFYKKEIDKLQQQIDDHINQHPELKQQRDLLTSIKGIGNHTAAILLSELPQIKHFLSVNQLVAYAGLSPRQMQSGSSYRRGGITKLGCPRLRAALFYPAMVAMRYNPHIAPFAERLRQRGKRPKQIIVGAMRKLLHLIYGILKHQKPYDPTYLMDSMPSS